MTSCGDTTKGLNALFLIERIPIKSLVIHGFDQIPLELEIVKIVIAIHGKKKRFWFNFLN